MFGGHKKGEELTRLSFWRVGAAGGLAGAANATLCYLRLPVPVKESGVTFHWHVIPAGCLHGALLALVAVGAFHLASRRSLGLQIAGLPVVAWVAGYLAWIPLDLSVSGRSILQALAWPADGEQRMGAILWPPLLYFGGVSALLYTCLLATGVPSSRKALQSLGAIAAAILGSLWWWIEWGPWYFAVIHGLFWGGLVGLALSREATSRRTMRWS